MKFNGGGHFNHEFFWETLCPVADSHRPDPEDLLYKEIVRTWGSWEEFQDRFEKRAAAVQGSGWGWVVYDKSQKRIRITTTAEQDQVSDVFPSVVPLMGVDMWEHAYYLDYRNMRPTYLKEMWKIINWQKVDQRLRDVMPETK